MERKTKKINIFIFVLCIVAGFSITAVLWLPDVLNSVDKNTLKCDYGKFEDVFAFAITKVVENTEARPRVLTVKKHPTRCEMEFDFTLFNLVLKAILFEKEDGTIDYELVPIGVIPPQTVQKMRVL